MQKVRQQHCEPVNNDLQLKSTNKYIFMFKIISKYFFEM